MMCGKGGLLLLDLDIDRNLPEDISQRAFGGIDQNLVLGVVLVFHNQVETNAFTVYH